MNSPVLALTDFTKVADIDPALKDYLEEQSLHEKAGNVVLYSPKVKQMLIEAVNSAHCNDFVGVAHDILFMSGIYCKQKDYGHFPCIITGVSDELLDATYADDEDEKYTQTLVRQKFSKDNDSYIVFHSYSERFTAPA